MNTTKITLKDINPSDIEPFSLEGEIHDCLVAPEDIYDGDTLKVVLIRNNEPMKLSVRMSGIDTPELHPLKNKPNRDIEMEKAREARDSLKEYIKGKHLRVKFLGSDKYGRLLGVLYIVVMHEQEIDVNQWLIDNKYAREYTGGKKTEWIF